MARFYFSGHNGSGNEIKAGGLRSVRDGHIRGWKAGIEVECFAQEDGTDRLDVYMTPGSTGEGHRVLLGQVFSAPPTAKRGPRWLAAKGRKTTHVA